MKKNQLLEIEDGWIQKDWRGRISFALVYPNYYNVGMSNLGFQSVYRILNNIDNVVCERLFLSDHPSPIRSIESGKLLSEFDIIGFSVSFENDYPNIPGILASSGIPIRASERNKGHPLIIAGGVAPALNPEPISLFIDCIVIGEAEPLLSQFIECFHEAAHNKTLFLDQAAKKLPGVYVPSFYEVEYNPNGTISDFYPTRQGIAPRIKKSILYNLNSHDTHTQVLTPKTEFASSFLIEMGRGCPHGCRFCAAGYVFRPPRFRSYEQLKRSIETGVQKANSLGLVSAAMTDIPQLSLLCEEILNRGVRISFSSLRADGINKDLADILKKSNNTTATIAPDAGSERLRMVINKGITEGDILNATEILVSAGIPNLKLYFMIGLPTETFEDIKELTELCKKVKHVFLKTSRGMRRLGEITISLNCFVPKPHTPFQWVGFEKSVVLKERIKYIKNELNKVPNIRVHADTPKWAYNQALIARGDRRLAGLLETINKNQGNWPKALKEYSVNPDFYVLRERMFEEKLPWDFIDHGITKEYLAREYKLALAGKTSPKCQPNICKACGVCK
ncbi:MAG: radical SAM protein [Pseudomonadota bacterium]